MSTIGSKNPRRLIFLDGVYFGWTIGCCWVLLGVEWVHRACGLGCGLVAGAARGLTGLTELTSG